MRTAFFLQRDKIQAGRDGPPVRRKRHNSGATRRAGNLRALLGI